MTNKVTCVGNLVKDVELKQTQNGKSFAVFTLAVATSAKDADGKYATIFYNVAVFGKLGETCATYLRKGSKALIIGDFTVREYKDTSGNDRVSYNINTDSVEFLTPKSEATTSQKTDDVDVNDDDYSPF